MRVRLIVVLCIALVSPFYAQAAIPAYAVPGAIEAEVRAALALADCQAWSADPKLVDCYTPATHLDGIPGRYKVTFAFGRLLFTTFSFDRKHFDIAIRAVTELLGAPNRTEVYEIPVAVEGKNATQKTKVWGNTQVLASVSLYTPGNDQFASIFLLHPAAVPINIRDTYLPSK